MYMMFTSLMFFLLMLIMFNMGYYLNFILMIEMIYLVLMNMMFYNINFFTNYWVSFFWILVIILISAGVGLLNIVISIRFMKKNSMTYYFY